MRVLTLFHYYLLIDNGFSHKQVVEFKLIDQRILDRKLEHIRIVVEEDVDFPDNCSKIYNGIRLIHQAYPGINLDDVDLSIDFLGYNLKYPIMITGMTGGNPGVKEINKMLALIADEYGIAIGVGSQRAMILHRNDDEIRRSYRVVRETARNVPVIGNIGANTLHDLSISEILDIVQYLEADALAIHFNPAQEAIQPEGDTRFSRNILDKIAELLDALPVPIIVKEVGNGLSYETVKKLHGVGINYFDVAGACGTNWILVEKYRSNNEVRKKIAEDLSNWGIPTPYAVVEARSAAPSSFIIASGGVWSGLRAVINIALGANMVGLAKPLIKNLMKGGIKQARLFMKTFIEEMRIVSFLIGVDNLDKLHRSPIVLPSDMLNYMKQRGLDHLVYGEARRFIK